MLPLRSPHYSCHVLPPFQKEGYTLLRKLYLKTPEDYRDSNCTIQN